MANVSFFGAINGMNIQPIVQGFYPVGKAPNNNKFAMKHHIVAAGIGKSGKKTKKYGAGVKAILMNVKTTRPLNCWIAYRSRRNKFFVYRTEKLI